MVTLSLRNVTASVAAAAIASAGLLFVPSSATANPAPPCLVSPNPYLASCISSGPGPVAANPAGTVVAVASASTVKLVWTSNDTSATTPAATTGNLAGPAEAMAFSSDGSKLVVAGVAGIQVFTVVVNATASTPTASLTLVSGTSSSPSTAWQLTSPLPGTILGAVATSTTSAVVLQEDASGDGHLVTYSFPTSGTVTAPVVVSRPEHYSAIALSKDSTKLYAATDTSIVVLTVSALTGTSTTIAINGQNVPLALAMSPDGATLAVGGADALVAITTSSNTIRATQVYPLADQGYPSPTSAWDPSPPQTEMTACDSVAFSSDSKTIYCAGGGATTAPATNPSTNLYWFDSATLGYRGALELNDAVGPQAAGLDLPSISATSTRVYVELQTVAGAVESIPQALISQASLPVGSTPGPPTNVAAVAGTDQITVSWTAPTNTGGLPLTGYTVTADPDCRTIPTPRGVCDGTNNDVDYITPPQPAPNDPASDDATCQPGGTGTSCTITSLQAWVPYTITVVAKNAKGQGSIGTASTIVTPGIAAAPTTVSGALQGDGSVKVSWTPSAFNGAAPVIGYRVTAVDAVKGGAALPCLATATALTAPDATSCSFNPTPAVAGAGKLVAGTVYRFGVVAVNHADHGDSSQTQSTDTLTYGAPSAPTGATVTPGDTSMVLTWAPPSYVGGTIKNYLVTLMPGSLRCGTTLGVDARNCTITGLTNGTHYSVSIVAVNSVGTGAPATFPDVVPATVPSSPTIASVTPGSGQLTVTWAPPVSDGGTPIAQYIATAKVNQSSVPRTCVGTGPTATSCIITGLNNGVTYTVTVTAYSAYSMAQSPPAAGAPSLAQTATPNGPPVAPAGIQATVKANAVTVTWALSTNTTVTGYQVQAEDGSGCEAAAGQNRCVMEGVEPGVHQVTVWAEAGSQLSDGSEPVTFTVLAKANRPKVVKKKIDHKHRRVIITFKWAPQGANVSGYRIERKNGNKRFVAGTRATYTFTLGGYRNIRVVALNGDGESAPSDWRRILAR